MTASVVNWLGLSYRFDANLKFFFLRYEDDQNLIANVAKFCRLHHSIYFF